MKESPHAFTVAEACNVARCGRTTIYQAINAGELRAVKRGRKTLFLSDDLMAWLRQLPQLRPQNGAPSQATA